MMELDRSHEDMAKRTDICRQREGRGSQWATADRPTNRLDRLVDRFEYC